MKRLEILVLFVVALASLTFYQCEQKEVSELADVNQNLTGDVSTTEANLDGEMVLGKKLQIPYALAIVENAQNQLKSKSPNFKPIKVKENYLYVRFTPKSEAEYDLINTDSTLNTFNHPLDYEIIKGGSTYKLQRPQCERLWFWKYLLCYSSRE